MMEYKRLGDYIRAVDVRNRDLKVTNLLGLSMSKSFRPSTSNVVGVDLSKYKVVHKNVFAFDPMSVIRVHKVPIAINNTDSPIIVSPAYITFECKNANLLDPRYLMMWFQRTEFDRYADFKSDAAVRGGYDWSELCETMVYIPDIEKQREIVAEYEILTNRIRLNEQIIHRLEATAQALYRKMFVENIDKENLPTGWRIGTFTEVIDICGGGTPSTDIIEYWEDGNIPFYSPGDKTSFYYSLVTGKHITEKGLIHCNSKLYPENTTFVTARGATTGGLTLTGCPMAMNQTCYALVAKDRQNSFYVHQLALEMMISLKNEAVGATFEALVTKDFENTEIVIAPIKARNAFNKEAEVLYENMLIIQQENTKLTELQSLLLAKMGK